MSFSHSNAHNSQQCRPLENTNPAQCEHQGPAKETKSRLKKMLRVSLSVPTHLEGTAQ